MKAYINERTAREAAEKRVEELEREKDKQTALAEHRRQRIELLQMQPSVAICQEERAEGNGGCGACALCCKEQREAREAAEAEVRRLEGEKAEETHYWSVRVDIEIQEKIQLRAEVRRLQGLIAHGALTPEFVTEAERIREREGRNG